MISFLKNVNNGSVFYLVNKEQFIVGRKDCDFLISNDQSISRKHAVIRIKEEKISVEDYGSKYSTLCNGKKMEPKKEKVLNNNDEIHFGVIDSKYRLEQHRIVTTGTRLNSTQKVQLKSDLAAIGGRYVEHWTSDCTHLTVEEITLTVKVLHAIIDGIPIVKPTYWTKYAENVGRNLPPPIIDKYNKPPIAEALLNNIEFKSDPSRKTLFKGKLFVFTKENDKKQMEELIRKAGGTSISWEKDPMPLEDIKKSPKEFILIQTSDTADKPDLNEVIKHFSKQGRRTIPLQEIATAIVLCSCEKNCNPNFNRVEEVFPVSQPSVPTQNNALVLGTQSQYFTATRYKDEDDDVQMIIPDTIESESVHFKKEPNDKTLGKNVINKQALKRQTDTNYIDEKPLKKAKVDLAGASSKSNQSDAVKQETNDIFLTKANTSQKRSVEQNEQSNSSLNKSKVESQKNPFLDIKRNKLDIKENSKNSNPFLSIKDSSNDVPQINDENPFMSSGKKKRHSDDDLDFSVCKKKKDESIFSSTRINNTSNISSHFPKTSKINHSNNSMWYSKDTSANVTTNGKENIENSFDTEIQNFIKQFRDTVVVEVITELPKRPTIFQDVVDGINNSKRHNFKRFVKVKPVKAQRLIIGRDNCVAVGPRETTGIADSRREYHFSDDEATDSRKTKKKAPKKFFI